MLSDQVDRLSRYFEAYGLGEESEIYLVLLENGPSTVLAISRKAGVPRTKVYRLLDKLKERGLVREDPRQSQLMVPAPYQELERQLVVEERRLAGLRADMPSLFGELAELVSSRASGSRLTFYDDVAGLATINENSLNARGELCIFEKAQDMSDFIPKEHAEEIRRGFAANKTSIRQLTNHKKLVGFSDVYAHVQLSTPRYLDPEILPIKFEVIIYNDMVAIYNHGEETFGLEIQSAPLAAMQRQLFDLAWLTAKPMRKVGRRGGAELIDVVEK